jgi:hypothetical protein
VIATVRLFAKYHLVRLLYALRQCRLTSASGVLRKSWNATVTNWQGGTVSACYFFTLSTAETAAANSQLTASASVQPF